MAVEQKRHFFVYGEVSRAIQASSSSDAYTQSLRRCKNAMIRPEGGVTNRLGTQMVATTETLDDRLRLLPLPSRILNDSFIVFPGLGIGETSPRAYDAIVTVDVRPGKTGYGVRVNIGDVLGIDDLIYDNEDFVDTGVITQTLQDLKYTTNDNALQVGFSTRHYIEFIADYADDEDTLRIVDGAQAKYVYLDAFDPPTYLDPDGPLKDIIFGPFNKIGSATGGPPISVVITLFNEVTNDELILWVNKRLVSPFEYSDTNRFLTTVDDLPENHVLRVYIAEGNTVRSCRLLGVVSSEGSTGGLPYIGQPVNTGVTFPLHNDVFNNRTMALPLTLAELNSYFLTTHLRTDFPYPLMVSPSASGLSFGAPAAAATWSNSRLILGGFGLRSLLDIPFFSYGTGRIALSTLITGDNPRPKMYQPASDASEELSFSVNLDGVNEVYHLIDHNLLLCFTDDGVKVVGGASGDGPLTRSQLKISSANRYVSDPDVQPVIAGAAVFFCLSQVASVMQAQFRRELNGYVFNEASFLSKDLFSRGSGFSSMHYTRENYNSLWCFHKGFNAKPTRDVTCLTLREDDQRVAAHQHDFGGRVIDAVMLDGKGRDSRIYMAVERLTRSGVPRIFIERMMNRELQNNSRDVVPKFQYRFYDGFSESVGSRYTGSFEVVGPDFEQGNTIVINTTDAHGLSLDAGNFIRLEKERENIRWDAEIISSTATSVTVISDDDCPFQGAITGAELIRLRSALLIPANYYDMDIGISVDGKELRSTVDPDIGAYEVPATGPVVFSADMWFDYAIIGFNYVSEVQSVSYVPPDDIPNVDVQKAVHSIDVEVENTRGLLISGYEPEDVTAAEMDQIKELDYGLVKDYYTGRFNVPLRGESNKHGRVLFRQIRPEPFTILGYEASIDI